MLRRIVTLLLIGCPALCCAPLASGADDAGAAVKLTVVTGNDEQIEGAVAGLTDGQLKLATEPPRAIALDEISRVDIGAVVGSAGDGSDLTWIGQDNHDLVQVGGASGGNGIQDIHLHASNLRPIGLKQVLVVCRFPGQLRVWRLDTSQSPHWRVAIERQSLGTEAEVYIEPGSIDAFGQRFEITYTYSDGGTTKGHVVARTHTSDKLKVDAVGGQTAVAPAVAVTGASDGEIALTLAGGDGLRGKLSAMTAETVTLDCGWKSPVEIPLLRVKGLFCHESAPAETKAEYVTQLAAPAAQDVVFVSAPDNSVGRIEVSVRGLADGKLSVRYQGADRQINLQRVVGIVFAAHPPLPAPQGLLQVFRLATGDVLRGRWIGADAEAFEVETLWSSRVRIPPQRIGQIRVLGGKVTSLADLEPVDVKQTAYFGRIIPWARDTGFDGVPNLKGKQPIRSLAMHSRCALTYDLDGRYDSFKATLGFDDSARQLGSVHCKVLVDGRELFDKPELRSTDEPLPVELDLKGARQMTLVVDFGAGQDVGDRILWAEPRLSRAAEPAAEQTTATP